MCRIGVIGKPRGAPVVALAPGMQEADPISSVVAGPRPVELAAVRAEDDPVSGIRRERDVAGKKNGLRQIGGKTVGR